ncbi:cupredoxin domain-containing protein [Neobacillus sp. SM06]|uniref:cupredoxin domain-containing protein n=1 Tax=Neobacillus sp. SM06 TaxID=3422492 RepID=UPI003D287C40
MKKIKVKKYGLELVFVVIVIAAMIPIVLDAVANVKNQGENQGTRVEISMSGFTPPVIRAKAGEKITIQLVNPDNSQHSDGGGWHQFASDELKIDYKLPPESTKTIQLKVDQPGEYVFYCDVCCGGKENPSMQGKLIIT